MVQKSSILLLKEVLRQAAVVKCSVVLLKDLVIAAETRALCPQQNLHTAGRHFTPLHNLKLHCSSEGKSTPDNDGASSTVPRRKHLQVGSPCHASNASLPPFHVPCLALPCNVQMGKFVAWDETCPLRTFWSLSPSPADAVLWLLGCSQHQ